MWNLDLQDQTTHTHNTTHNPFILTTFHPRCSLTQHRTQWLHRPPSSFQTIFRPYAPSAFLQHWSIPQAAVSDPCRKQHQSEGLASWCFSIKHNDKDILSATFDCPISHINVHQNSPSMFSSKIAKGTVRLDSCQNHGISQACFARTLSQWKSGKRM